VIVRADGPGHAVNQLELPGVDPGRDPIELRVGRGATIVGTVSSMDRWRELMVDPLGKPAEGGFDRLGCCVVLRSATDGLLQKDNEGIPFPIRADGTFVCSEVPPGRWQLLFQYYRPSVGGLGSTGGFLHRSLAEVVAMPGQRHEVTFDLGQTLPCLLHGHILLDGEPRTASELTIDAFGRDHLGHPQSELILSFGNHHGLHADGTYELGTFAGDIEFDAHIDGKVYRLFERIPLAPGEHKEVDLHFRHLVARIHLAREDGSPVTNRVVRAGELLTWVGEDGWGTLDPVRELRFDVDLLRPGIDRSELAHLKYNDPSLRPEKAGHLELDAAQPTSEHRLTVREP
jgi:hypothetical protein